MEPLASLHFMQTAMVISLVRIENHRKKGQFLPKHFPGAASINWPVYHQLLC